MKQTARERLENALADYGCTVRGSSAQCPGPGHSNGDRNASLSIDDRRDGRGVVLNCHRGCDRRVILKALGMSDADLFDEPRESQVRRQVVAEYSYTDEDGRELFRKVRYDPKGFTQYRRVRGQRVNNLDGVRKVLYQLPQVLAAVRDGQAIYLAEGEKDVHALELAGVTATCNFDGAADQGKRPKWRPEYGDMLKGAEVVIVADRDEPGRAHAAAAAADLAGKARSVRVVEAAEGKDAADHLTAGYSLEDFRPVADDGPRESVISESAADVSDTSDGSDSSTEDDARLLAAVRDGTWLTGQDFPPLAYAVDGLIPEGFTLLVGPPKAGKSWLTLALLLAVASGGVALGAIKAAPSRRVLYLALEDGDRRMQDRCRALLDDHEDIPALFHYMTRLQPGMLLPTLDAWMRRHPDTAMVVVDTLGKVMPPAMNGESAYQRDYRVGAALKSRADSTPGLAVVVLHHDRKAVADDFVDAVSGTHGLAGAADTVVVLCRKRQSTEGLLKVTGRDVPEDSYALTISDGKTWQLDGASLRAAAAAASKREDSQALGDKSLQVLAAVRAKPEGIRAGDLVPQFGKDVYQYLGRLMDAGRIDKVNRGLYIAVSEPSGLSETQVSEPPETDDASPVSETAELWPGGSYGEAAS